MVWPCFHAGTTSPAGTLRLKRKSPVPTGSAAPRRAELGRAARFSSLVAAPGHGGLIRVLPGSLFPQDRIGDLHQEAPLETIANHSVPMACGPNVDQARPARGGSGAPRGGPWLARRPPPAAPDKRARPGDRLVRGSPGGVWARDIPLYRR